MIETITRSPLFNYSFAFDAGLHVPELKYLKNLSEDEIYEIQKDVRWLIKYPYFAVRRVDGVYATLIDYWDGERFSFPHVSFNNRYLLDGDQGVELGANAITLFKNRDRIGEEEFSKIGKTLADRGETEPTYVLLDCFISKNGIFFYGIDFDLVPDYLSVFSKLYGVGVEFFDYPNPTTPTIHNFSSSLRLYSYPYSPSDNIKMIESLPIDHRMELAITPECFIVLSSGKRVYDCWRNLYASIPIDLKEFGICYRTDGDKMAKDAFFKLKRDKYIGGSNEK